jgi:CRP-like cAMP-binding protein
MISSAVVSTVRELKPRFLEGLAPAELKLILNAATKRRFLEGSVISYQGHSANHLFLLLEGSARYFYLTQEGQKILLRWLPPGEIFGGSTLLRRPSEYKMSTEMVKAGCALEWDRAAIRGLALRYPRLLENVLEIVSDYLDGYVAVHISLTCHTARQRLARVLVTLASGIGRRVPGGIELSVGNEDLGNAANVTTYTVSRLLSAWHRSGLLVKSRKKILLPSPEQLLLHEV